ncbi:protein of unknown function [Micropruina glycogenica]|uniref:Uncharacterized protein n=1 Tax=Micropruina glycogenica TaxID=75385 RepID=A0A2N9JCV6_9ACTN|nr:protein of unknown function [Micropruina glycogenica]
MRLEFASLTQSHRYPPRRCGWSSLRSHNLIGTHLAGAAGVRFAHTISSVPTSPVRLEFASLTQSHRYPPRRCGWSSLRSHNLIGTHLAGAAGVRFAHTISSVPTSPVRLEFASLTQSHRYPPRRCGWSSLRSHTLIGTHLAGAAGVRFAHTLSSVPTLPVRLEFASLTLIHL